MIEKYKGNKDFLKMSNATIRDTSLSLEARGLLAVILSFPENYNITNAELVELSGLSKRTINRLLLELESSGRYFSTKKVGGAKRVEWERNFYDLSATSGAYKKTYSKRQYKRQYKRQKGKPLVFDSRFTN